ncbi:hypothetical protein DRA43_19765 [Micromonospora provocatoris]|nr:hypothetical protein DRA43_19765 [Micromonospora provocatoris]
MCSVATVGRCGPMGVGAYAHEVVTGCSAARQGHPRQVSPESGCGAEGGKRVSRVDRAVAQRG